MKTKFYSGFVLLISVLAITSFLGAGKAGATSINVAGNITMNQTWSYDTINVIGHVTVNNGVRLTIDPGVLVRFMGHFRINVKGSIRALGVNNDLIRFTAADTTDFADINDTAGGWYGIRFDSTLASNDTSYLRYCFFEFSKVNGTGKNANGGVLLVYYFSKLVVSYCTFDHNIAKSNGGGIFLRRSNAMVRNCTFSYNKCSSGGGIYASSGNANIYNNIFNTNFASSGGGGVMCADTTTMAVTGNLFHHNMGLLGGGINCFSSNAKLNNNTIIYNKATHGGGLACINSSPTLKNDILFYNTGSGTGPQVSLLNAGSNPNFYFCDVQGDSSAFGGGGAPSYAGIYLNNISTIPQFQDTLANDYLIKHSSPCLDGGTTDTTGLKLPASDLAGNPRINMGRIDIGAYERQQIVNVCGIISQNTLWNADTVKVTCDLTINNGVTLTIMPAVYVQFQDTFRIRVNGRISAMGAAGDTIVFTDKNMLNWRGIEFDHVNVANDSSRFAYCKFLNARYDAGAGGAMRMDHSSKIRITHCMFSYNRAYDGGAIGMTASSPVITSTVMNNNNADWSFGNGGAICCYDNSSPVIIHLRSYSNQSSHGGSIYSEHSQPHITSSVIADNFAFNAGGIFMDSSSVSVKNSVIVNNYALNKAGGMLISASQADITNSTIAHNRGIGGAAYIEAADPVFTNCIIYDDSSSYVSANEICISDTLSYPEFYYCDIKNDTTGFIYDTSNTLNVIYMFNIDTLPGFNHPSDGAGTGYYGIAADWSLHGCSPMYNMGDPDTSGLHLPALDLAGSTRIYANRVDIGAFELVKPHFMTQPADAAACVGGNVSFSVSVQSNIPVTYQWQLSTNGGITWNNISGETSDSLTLLAVTSGMSGYKYRCVISGDCSSQQNSTSATLTVNTPPLITVEPVDEDVCQGATSYFDVTATGSGLTYQWQQRPFGSATWTNCAGSSATTAHYSIPNTPLGLNNYSYRCIISGSCLPGDTTLIADLLIKGLPTVVTQPTNVSVCADSNATFTVTASGSGITYQWQLSTNGGTTWNNINGQTSNFLALTAVTSGMSGYKYRCVISGDCQPPANSNAATLTVNTAPAVTQQPVNTDVCVYSDVNITVTATGGNLAFQWQQKATGSSAWSNAPGLSALTDTYQLTNVQLTMDGYKFRCLISGSCPPGIMTDSITLNVYNLPSVYIGVDTTIGLSKTIILDAGSGYSAYLWSTGATTQTISVTGSVLGLGAHQITCTITDAHGCQNSDALVVTVVDDVGIASYGSSDQVIIWPNPAKDMINISFGDVFAGKTGISMLNVLGEKIIERGYSTLPGMITLDVNRLLPGLYYLRIETDNKVLVKKITVLK